MCTANMRWLILQKSSSIQISTIKMHFNSHMGLDLCFKLINGWLSNYSYHAANLNINAVSFFLLTLYVVSTIVGCSQLGWQTLSAHPWRLIANQEFKIN